MNNTLVDNKAILSKTNFIRGLQCHKLLWVAVNEKDRMPPTDPVTQHIFNQGHEVGYLAQTLFPGGINLTEDFDANLKATREAMLQRLPLFEAGFRFDRLYCRVDILRPAGEDGWDIIEVKSSTEAKTEHLQDVAFQRYVLRLCGLDINRCYVMHLNKEYVRHGEIDTEELFIIEDVTDRLDQFSANIENYTDSMLACIDSDNCPDGIVGHDCDDPYRCGLKEECWAFLPKQHVLTLNYGKTLGQELLNRGILDIRDIPADVELKEKQQIQVDCAKSGQHYINKAELHGFLKTLEHPLYFMDFETFQTAVPLYDGTRPYQQVPFQFSVHVVRNPGDAPEHYSYLHDGQDDPRPRFLDELSRVIGDEGSILVYFQPFEEGRLKEGAEMFPQHSLWIENVRERMVDLIAPFKGFLYYHPDQCGSASLKQVMPALTSISYDGLEINEGGLASVKYIEATFEKEISDKERRKIRENLLVYCGQDTGGMIDITEKLTFLSKDNSIRGDKHGLG